MPTPYVSHTCQHDDLSRFSGKSVIVIGGGQSALESAAILAEAGAHVRVLVRASQIHWLIRSSRLHRMQSVRRMLYAPADIGPAGLSWVVASPRWFKRLPIKAQVPLARRSIRPAGSGWLVPRLAEVPIELNSGIAAVNLSPNDVGLELRREGDDFAPIAGFTDNVQLGG
jgi:hypothetical protein